MVVLTNHLSGRDTIAAFPSPLALLKNLNGDGNNYNWKKNSNIAKKFRFSNEVAYQTYAWEGYRSVMEDFFFRFTHQKG